MKIAMVSHYLPSGSKIGVGFQVHYLANAMVRRGHAVTLFSRYAPPEDALYDGVVVPVGRSLRTFRFAWNLREYDFSGFDVLHTNGDDYWLWDRRRPTHVRTMLGSSLAEALHIPGLKGKLRMTLLGMSEVAATRIAHRTVCISENTRRSYPWLRDVIPCGVDTSAFSPAEQQEPVPTILFVGTYLRRKRGKLLMDQFLEQIRPAIPEAQLWMVSEDAPEAPGVTQFCRIPLEQLADLYRRAWVFCLPSSYEGFGVPYIEAMASGTPVVATPNVGAREVLADGKYGILAEPEALGATLIKLLQDASERSRYRQSGLERARDFSWERIVDQYERVYAETARKRGRAKSPAVER